MSFPTRQRLAYAAQTPRVQLTLPTLYALVTCLCNAVAFVMALAYPINHARYRAIRAGVCARREGCPVFDPLKPAALHPGAST